MMQYIVYPDLPATNGFVATTGFFDGVHLGHRAVLQRTIEVAKNVGKSSCVISFWPHPRIVLHNDASKLNLLSTLDEKRELVEQAGIEYFIVIPFTHELSQLTAEQFFNDCLLKRIGIHSLIVGYDHHFGKGGQADFGSIRQLGAKAGIFVEQVTASELNGATISSSKIREALQHGELALANSCLGYTYSLSGVVVDGKKIGRQLGFPTANIQPEDSWKLLPKDGIYAVEVQLAGDDTMYKGMLSIGVRPTVDDGKKRTIEVNIFDFDRMIYGETLTVRFIQRLRDELKFDSLDALRAQLIVDELNTLSVFAAK